MCSRICNFIVDSSLEAVKEKIGFGVCIIKRNPIYYSKQHICRLQEWDMEFTVMHKDEPVAHVKISEDKKQVSIEKLIPDSYKQPFCGDREDIFRVYDFLESRCYENGRADLAEILEMAGMCENNPWEWIKRTHGVVYEDFIWIRFPGENLEWKDVAIR